MSRPQTFFGTGEILENCPVVQCRPVLSMLIPCRNEEASIPPLLERLGPVVSTLEAEYEVEVVLVDDGSTDQTFALMRRLIRDRHGYAALSNPRNLGIGGTIRRCLPLLQGEIIITLDCDGTYDPATIPALLAELEGADVAVGSPYHPRGQVENVPAWRLFLSRSLSRVYRQISPVKVWTYTGMFRAYRRRALERIQWESDGFLSMAEILDAMGREGYRVAEFPTVLSVRRYGQSKFKVAQSIREHLGFIGQILFRRDDSKESPLGLNVGHAQSRERSND